MVRKPQSIWPAEGLTVSKAIELAGGFADFADRRKVRVSRRKENRSFTVDVKAVLQKKPGAEDPLLEAGDVVFVATRVVD
jgi:protein involved in polysaccharide export with SLBB domain